MTRVDIAGTHSRNDVEWPVVGNTDHQVHRAHCVSHSIQRLDELLFPLRQKFGVLLLNVGRISKHDGTKVPGCRRRPDCLGVAFRDQVRKTPGVVDVGV